ncbi:MAG: DUF4920 domain-containing protein [Bacteroidota bacterium]|jgi:hypothetical protein
MKNILFVFVISCFFISCNQNQIENSSEEKNNLSLFGDSITPKDAQPSAKILELMNGKDSVPMKLEGKITDVCQKKGCWMEVEMGSGKSFRVVFKDYAFFVPKDATGKNAIIEGFAQIDTISVAQLKEYASDAGKSKSEIDAISKPETELSFEARGVIIK